MTALLVVCGAGSANALEDIASNVVPQGVRVYTNNGYHTYRGLYVNVQYGTPSTDVCAKSITRDGTIRNGVNPCGTGWQGWSNCLPTGEPVSRAYGYWTGGGGAWDTRIAAQTGSCY